jgi:hypothetical protein
MQEILIEDIIEKCRLSKREVADHLFPTNKFAMVALGRVIKKEALLDSEQISKLALMSGRTISELYTGEGWKARNKAGIHIITNGDYIAELDTQTNITKIYHKGSMFHESILHDGAIALSDYLKELDNQILKFTENE